MDEWISKHWNAIWGLVIYSYRMIHDLCFGGSNWEHKIEKLKNIGQDLYWISMVLWGVVLLNIDSQYLSSYLGKTIQFRFLILFGFVALGPILNKIRQVGEDFTGGAIKKWQHVVGLGVIYLVIHLIGLGSFLFAFYLIGR